MSRIKHIMRQPPDDVQRPVRFMPSMNIKMRLKRADEINAENHVRVPRRLVRWCGRVRGCKLRLWQGTTTAAMPLVSRARESCPLVLAQWLAHRIANTSSDYARKDLAAQRRKGQLCTHTHMIT